MGSGMNITRMLLYLGIVASIFAWVVIGLCWVLNPWFVFTRDAFSDFGGGGSCCPWLYNYGLIVTGVTVVLYGSALCLMSKEKLETIGGSYISLSGVFLALIGIFPTGTDPHVFVSTWFFLQIFIGFIILGFGLYRRGVRYGLKMSVMVISALVSAIIIELVWGWPSAAVVEACGIIVIDICVVFVTLTYLR